MKIEKNIPIPPINYGFRQNRKYSFDTWEVGDSMLDTKQHVIGKSKLYIAASQYQYRNKRSGIKFAGRQVKESSGEIFVRVWRIA